jgi:hypothetical protein
MYTTTRKATGTVTTCKDCDYEMSLNEICRRPLRAATDMLKHLTVHNAARALAKVQPVMAAGGIGQSGGFHILIPVQVEVPAPDLTLETSQSPVPPSSATISDTAFQPPGGALVSDTSEVPGERLNSAP